MEYEWDNYKNHINVLKHRVTFETAIFAFHDPFMMSELIDDEYFDENRWISIGLVNDVVLVIIHTWRINYYGEEINRIISARTATPREEQ